MNNERRTDQESFIQDESRDRSYFTIVPQLVWALCQDTYEFTLWHVIKMIAGEDGQCTLSSDQLAKLSMMSEGKVISCRQRLIDIGLLEGRIRRDPGYPQAVWHLRIPDLWPENLDWRRQYNPLIDRIEFKRLQREALKDARSPEEPSPDEGLGESSRGEDMGSPGEGLGSPDEGLPSRGDDKEEPLRRTKEEPKEELCLLWEKAKRWLADQMHRSMYETWVAPAKLVSFQGENGSRDAVISGPDAWTTEYLREKMDVVIRRALAGVLDLGEDQIQIRYTTGETT